MKRMVGFTVGIARRRITRRVTRADTRFQTSELFFIDATGGEPNDFDFQ